MTTQDLINTLKQGKPMTDKLVREIVRELEEQTEQARTMSTALRAKDADYVVVREALAQEEQYTAELTQKNRALAEELADAKNKGSAAERAIMGVRDVCALPDVSLEDLPGQIENLLSELADRQIRADIEPEEFDVAAYVKAEVRTLRVAEAFAFPFHTALPVGDPEDDEWEPQDTVVPRHNA